VIATSVAFAAIAGFVVTLLGTGLLIRVLTRGKVLDIANERSSHDVPRPRGGGLAICAGLAVGFGIAAFGLPSLLPLLWILLPFALLAVVSWLDDRQSLPWRLRLAAHGIAVATGLFVLLRMLAPEWTFGLVVLTALLGFAWLWFTNAFNFMDGIDGIASIEAIMIGLGVAAVSLRFALPGAELGLVLAASVAGFLIWNWPPSRIFMGDVGSIPLGFFCGFLLCWLALSGALAAALILPAYFLADATLTLLKRLLRGERLTDAHKSHWYQRAAGKTAKGHRQIDAIVIATNAVLIVLAWASAGQPVIAAVLCLAGALGTTLGCLIILEILAQRASHGT
jgi:UDP-N-acetylmuramyl pentapeptide phosphotransferase/UDP-N-acetylglucosamine-1-phosphate transferase